MPAISQSLNPADSDQHGMRHLWIRAGFMLAALAFVLTLTSLQRSRTAWEEALGSVEELQGAFEQRRGRRTLLRGEPSEGLAFESYARAVAQTSPKRISRLAIELGRCFQAFESEDPSARQERRRLLLANKASLDALAQGARCADASFRLEWERGFSGRLPMMLEHHSLVRLGILAAQSALDHGDSERAVQHLLDNAQLGCDLLHTPVGTVSLTGCLLISITTFEALVDQGMLQRLSPEGLRMLADGLYRLDSELQRPLLVREGDLVAWVHRMSTVEDATLGGWPLHPMGNLMAWRYGFSVSAMQADHVARATREIELLAASEGQPWPARDAALLQAAAELQDPSNVITELTSGLGQSRTAERALYECRARLRLVIAAVEYRLTGETPEIEDPFGGRLQAHMVGGVLRLTSAGSELEHVTPGRFTIELQP